MDKDRKDKVELRKANIKSDIIDESVSEINKATSEGKDSDSQQALESASASKTSETVVAESDNERKTIKNGDNQTAAASAAKKRRRRRGKPVSDTSGTGSFTSSERLDSLDTFSDKDGSLDTSGDKSVDWSEQIKERIAQIEGGCHLLPAKTVRLCEINPDFLHSDSDVNIHLTLDREGMKYTMTSIPECSPSEKEKQKITVYIGDEDIRSSKEIGKSIPPIILPRRNKAGGSVGAVIFVSNKATQTDPLPEDPSISKLTDVKNSTIFNLDSDSTVTTKATHAVSLLPAGETKPETVSGHSNILDKETKASELTPLLSKEETKTEKFSGHSDILDQGTKATELTPLSSTEETKTEKVSGHSDILNKGTEATALTPLPSSEETNPEKVSGHSDILDKGTKATESTPLTSKEETKPAKVPELIVTLKEETASSSSLNSLDQNLQSIMDDFMRDMEISRENFVEGFMKCLKNEK